MSLKAHPREERQIVSAAAVKVALLRYIYIKNDSLSRLGRHDAFSGNSEGVLTCSAIQPVYFFFINARGLGVRRKFVRGSKAHAILARTPAREANQGGVKHGNFFFKIGITSFYGLSDGSKLSQSSTDKRGETR